MDTEASYDRVADEYVRRIADELRDKQLDRELLDRFAAEVGNGPACDLGCGPGHVAAHLHARGVRVFGLDLSAELVDRARRRTPGVEFRHGDMAALDLADASLAGIAAFYSVIHVPRAEVARVLGGLRRVLRPGGVLLLAFHVGDGAVHLDEWWGHAVNVDFHFFQPAEMAGYLAVAGFEVGEVIEREPYPDVEHPSRRCYLFARRPAAG